MKDKLIRAVKSLGGRFLPIEEWTEYDEICGLLIDDGFPLRNVDECLVEIENNSYLGYTRFKEFLFSVSVNWIPLWHPEKWTDCIRMAKPGCLYAVAYDDYEWLVWSGKVNQDSLRHAKKAIKRVGFHLAPSSAGF